MLQELLRKVIPGFDVKEYGVECCDAVGNTILVKKSNKPGQPNVVVEESVETTPDAANLSEENLEVTKQVREFKEQLADGSFIVREHQKTIVRPKIQKPESKKVQQERFLAEFIPTELPSYTLEDAKTETQTLKDGKILMRKIFKKKSDVKSNEADVVEEIVECGPEVNENNSSHLTVERVSKEGVDKDENGKVIKKLTRKSLITPKKVENVSVEERFLRDYKLDDNTIMKLLPTLRLTDYHRVEHLPDGSAVLLRSYNDPAAPSVMMEEALEIFPNTRGQISEIQNKTREIKEIMPDGTFSVRVLKKKIIKPESRGGEAKENPVEKLVQEFQLDDIPNYVIDDTKTEIINVDRGGILMKKVYNKIGQVANTQADVIEEIVELRPIENDDDLAVEVLMKEGREKAPDGKTKTKITRKTTIAPKSQPESKFAKDEVKKNEEATKKSNLEVTIFEKILNLKNHNEYRLKEDGKGNRIWYRLLADDMEPGVVVDESIEMAAGIEGSDLSSLEIVNKIRDIKEKQPNGVYVIKKQKKTIVQPKMKFKEDKKRQQERYFDEFLTLNLPSYTIENSESETRKLANGAVLMRKVFRREGDTSKDEADTVEEIVERHPGLNEENEHHVDIETSIQEIEEKTEDGNIVRRLVKKTVVKPKEDGSKKRESKEIKMKMERKELENKEEEEKRLKLEVLRRWLAGMNLNIDTNDYPEVTTTVEGGSVLKKTFKKPGQPNVVVEESVETTPDAANLSEENLEVTKQVREFKEQLPDGSFIMREHQKTIVRPKIRKPEDKKAQLERFLSSFILTALPSYIEDGKTNTQTLRDGKVVMRKVFKKKSGINSNEADVVEEVVETTPGLDERNADNITAETFSEEVMEKGKGGKMVKKVIRKTIIKPKTIEDTSVDSQVLVGKKIDHKKEVVTPTEKKTPKEVDRGTLELFKNLIPQIDTSGYTEKTTTVEGGSVLKKTFKKPGQPNVVVEESVETTPDAANLSEENLEVTKQVREFKEQLPDGSFIVREHQKTIVRPKIQKPESKKVQQERFLAEFIPTELPSYTLEDAKTKTLTLKDGNVVMMKIFKKKPGVQSNEADVVEEVVETTPGLDERNADNITAETFSEEVMEKGKGGKMVKKVIRKTIIKPKTIEDTSVDSQVLVGKKIDHKKEVVTPTEKKTPKEVDRGTLELFKNLIPQIDTSGYTEKTTTVEGGSVLKKTFKKPGQPNVVVEESVETTPDAANLSEENLEVTKQVREFKEQLPDGSFIVREHQKTIVRPKIQKPESKKVQQERFLAEFIPSELPSYTIENAKAETQTLKDGKILMKKIFKKKSDVKSNEADVVEEVVETTPGLDERNADNITAETFSEEVMEKGKGGKMVKKVIRKTIIKPKTIEDTSVDSQVLVDKKIDHKKEVVTPTEKETPKEVDRGTLELFKNLIPQIDTSGYTEKTTTVEGGSVLKKTFKKPGQPNVVVEESVETTPDAANLSEENLEVTKQVREFKEQLPDGSFIVREHQKTIVRPKIQKPESKKVQQERFLAEFIPSELPSYTIENAKAETQTLKDGKILMKKIFKKKSDVKSNEADVVEEVVETTPGLDERNADNITAETFSEEVMEKGKGGKMVKKVIRKTIIKPKTIEDTSVDSQVLVGKKIDHKKEVVTPTEKKTPKEVDRGTLELFKNLIPQIDTSGYTEKTTTVEGGSVLKKTFKKPGQPNVVVEESVETTPDAANLSEENLEVTKQVREFKEQLPDGSFIVREHQKTIVRPKIQKPESKKVQQERFLAEFIPTELPSYTLEDAKTKTLTLKDGNVVMMKIFKKKPGVQSNEADVVEEVVETTPGLDERNADNITAETFSEEVMEKGKGGKMVKKVIRKTIIKPKTIEDTSVDSQVLVGKKIDHKKEVVTPTEKKTPKEVDRGTLELFKNLIPQIDTSGYTEKTTTVEGGSVLKKTFKKPGQPNVVVEESVETTPDAANLSEENLEVTKQVREFKEQLPDGSFIVREHQKTIVRPKIQKPESKKVQQERFLAEFIPSELPSYTIENAKAETQTLKDGKILMKKIFKKKSDVKSNEADVVEEVVETTPGLDERNADNITAETFSEEVMEKGKGGKMVKKVIRKTIIKPKTIEDTSVDSQVLVGKKIDHKKEVVTPTEKKTPKEVDRGTLELFKNLIPQIDTSGYTEKTTTVEGGSVLKKTFKKPGQPNVVVEESVETTPDAANLSEENLEVTKQVREFKEQLPDGSFIVREHQKTIVRPKIQKPESKKVQQERFLAEFIPTELPSYTLEDAKTKTLTLKDGNVVMMKIFKKKPGVQSNEADVVEEFVETTPGLDERNADNITAETFSEEVMEKGKGGKMVKKVIRKTIIKPKTIEDTSVDSQVLVGKKIDHKKEVVTPTEKKTPKEVDRGTLELFKNLIPQIDTSGYTEKTTTVEGGSVLKKTFKKPGQPNVVVEESVETTPDAANLSEENLEVTKQVREFKEQLPDGSFIVREHQKTIVRPKIQKPESKKVQQERFLAEFIPTELPSYTLEDAKTKTLTLKDGNVVMMKIFKKKPGVQSNEADVVEEVVETTPGLDERNADNITAETFSEEVMEKGKGGKMVKKVIRKTIIKPKTIEDTSVDSQVLVGKKIDHKKEVVTPTEKKTPKEVDRGTLELFKNLIPQIDTSGYTEKTTTVEGGSVLKKTFKKPGQPNVVVEESVETTPDAANLSEENLEVTKQVREFKEQLPDGSFIVREHQKTIVRPKIQKPESKKVQQERFLAEFIPTELPSYTLEDAKTKTLTLKDGNVVMMKIFKKKPGVQSNEADVVEEFVETTPGLDERNADNITAETFSEEVMEKGKGGKMVKKVIRKTIIKPKTIEDTSVDSQVLVGKKIDHKKEVVTPTEKKTPKEVDRGTLELFKNLIPQIDTSGYTEKTTTVEGGSVLKKTFKKPGQPNVVVEESVETTPDAANLSEENLEVTKQVREFKEQLPDGSFIVREHQKTIVRPKIQKPESKKVQQERFLAEFIPTELPSYTLEDAKTKTLTLKDGNVVMMKIFKKKPGVQSNEADVVEEVVETTPGLDERNADNITAETFSEEVMEKGKGGKMVKKVIRKTIIKPKTIEDTSVDSQVLVGKKIDHKKEVVTPTEKKTPKEVDRGTLELFKNLIPQIDTSGYTEKTTTVEGGSVLKKTFKKPGQPNVVVEESVETTPDAANLSEENLEVTKQVREFKEQLPDGSFIVREHQKTIVRPKIQKPESKKVQQERFLAEFIPSELPSYTIENAKAETQTLKDGKILMKKIFKKKSDVKSNEADVVEEVVETTPGLDERNADNITAETFSEEVMEKGKGGKMVKKVIRKTIIKPKTIEDTSVDSQVLVDKKIDHKKEVVTPTEKETPKEVDRGTLELFKNLIPQIDTSGYTEKTTTVEGGSVLKKTFKKPGQPNVVVEESVETTPDAANLSEENLEVTKQVREFKEQLPDGSFIVREHQKTIVRPKIQKPESKKVQQERFLAEFIPTELPSYTLEDAKTKTLTLKDGNVVMMKIFKKKPGVQSNEADVVEEVVETTPGLDERNADNITAETFSEEVMEKGKGGKMVKKVIRKTIIKPKTIEDTSVDSQVLVGKKIDHKKEVVTPTEKKTPKEVDRGTLELFKNLIPQIDTSGYTEKTTTVEGGSVLKKTFKKPGQPNVVVEESVETTPDAANLSEENLEVTKQVREFKEQLPDGSFIVREHQKTIVRPKIQKPESKKVQQERFLAEFIPTELPSYTLEDAKTKTLTLKDGNVVMMKIFKKKPGVQSNEADVVEEVVETTPGLDERNADNITAETFSEEVMEKGKGGKMVKKVIRKTIIKPKTIEDTSVDSQVLVGKKIDHKKEVVTPTEKKTPKEVDRGTLELFKNLIPQIDTSGYTEKTTTVEGGSVLKKTFKKPGQPNVVVEESVETTPDAANLSEENLEVTKQVREFKEQLPDGSFIVREHQKTIVRPKIQKPESKKVQQERFLAEFIPTELPSYTLEDAKTKTLTLKDGNVVMMKIFKKKPGVQSNEADVVEEFVETTPGLDERNADNITAETFSEEVMEKGKGGKMVKKVIRKTIIKPKTIEDTSVDSQVLVGKKIDHKKEVVTPTEKKTPKEVDRGTLELFKNLIPQIDTSGYTEKTTTVEGGSVLKKTFKKPGQPNVVVEESVETTPDAANLSEENLEVTKQVREFKEQLPDGSFIVREHQKTIVRPKIQKPESKKVQQERFLAEFIPTELPSYTLEDAKTKTLTLKDGNVVMMKIFKKKPGVQSNEADVVEEVVETTPGLDERNADNITAETFSEEVMEKGKGGKMVKKVIRKTIIKPKTIEDTSVDSQVLVGKKIDHKKEVVTPTEKKTPKEVDRGTLELFKNLIPQIDTSGYTEKTTTVEGGSVLKKTFKKPGQPNVVVEESVETTPDAANLSEENLEVTKQVREFKEQLPDGSFIVREHQKTIVRPKIQKPESKKVQQERFLAEFIPSELPSYTIENAKAETQTLKDGKILMKKIFKKKSDVKSNEADVVEEVVETTPGLDERNADNITAETFSEEVMEKGKGGKMVKKVIRKTIIKPKTIEDTSVDSQVLVDKKIDHKKEVVTPTEKETPKEVDRGTLELFKNLIPQIDTSGYTEKTTTVEGGSVLKKTFKKPGQPNVVVEESVETTPDAANLSEENLEVTKQVREFKEQLPDGSFIVREHQKTIVRPKIQKPESKKVQQERFLAEFIPTELPSYTLEDAKTKTLTLKDGNVVMMKIFKKKPGVQSNEADVVEEVVETTPGLDERNADNITAETFSEEVMEKGKGGKMVKKVIRKTIIKPKTIEDTSVDSQVLVGKKIDHKKEVVTPTEKKTPKEVDRGTLELFKNLIPQIDTSGYTEKTTTVEGGSVLKKTFKKPGQPNVVVEESVETTPDAANLSEENLEVTKQVREFKEQLPDGSFIVREHQKTIVRPRIRKPEDKKAQLERFLSSFILTALPSYIEDGKTNTQTLRDGKVVMKKIFKKKSDVKSNEADVVEEVVETTPGLDERNADNITAETFSEEVMEKGKGGKMVKKVIRKTIIKPKTIEDTSVDSQVLVGKKIDHKKEVVTPTEKKTPKEVDRGTLELFKNLIPQIDTSGYTEKTTTVEGGSVLKKTFKKPGQPNVVVEESVETTPDAANLSEENLEVTKQVREFKEQLPDGSFIVREHQKTIVRPKIRKPEDKKAQLERFLSSFILTALPSYIEDGKTNTQTLRDGKVVMRKVFKKKSGINSNEADVVEEVVETTPGLDERNADNITAETFSEEVMEKGKGGKMVKKVIRKTIIKPKTIEDTSVDSQVLVGKKIDHKKEVVSPTEKKTPKEVDRGTLELFKNLIPQIDTSGYTEKTTTVEGGSVLKKTFKKPGQPNVVVEESVETTPDAANLSEENLEVTKQVREFKEQLPDGSFIVREHQKTIVRPKIQKPESKKVQQERFLAEFIPTELPSYTLEDAKTKTLTLKDGNVVMMKIFKKKPGVQSNEADVVEEVVETTPGLDERNADNITAETFSEEVMEKGKGGKMVKKVIRKTIIKPKTIEDTSVDSQVLVGKKIDHKKEVVTPTEKKTPKEVDRGTLELFKNLIPQIDTSGYTEKTTTVEGGSVLKKTFKKPGQPNVVVEESVETTPDAANLSEENLEVTKQVREFKEQLPDGSFIVREHQKTIVRPKIQKPESKKVQQERFLAEFIPTELPSYTLEDAKTKTLTLKDGNVVMMKIFKKKPGVQSNEADVVEESVETTPGLDERNADNITAETFSEEVMEKGKGGKMVKKVIRKTIIKPKTIEDTSVDSQVLVDKKIDHKKELVTPTEKKTPKEVDRGTLELFKNLIPQIDTSGYTEKTTTVEGGSVLKKTFKKPGQPNVVVEESVETTPDAANLSEENLEVTKQVREFKEQLPDGSFIVREHQKTIVRPKIRKPEDKKAQLERFLSSFILTALPSYIEDGKTNTQTLRDGKVVMRKVFKKKSGINSNEADVVEEVVETTPGLDERNADNITAETFSEEVMEKGKGGKMVKKVIRKTIIKPKTIEDTSVDSQVLVGKKIDHKKEVVSPTEKKTPKEVDRGTLELFKNLIPQIDTSGYTEKTTTVEGGSVLKKTFKKPGQPNVVVEESVETTPDAANLSEENLEVTKQVREFKEQLPDGSFIMREQQKTIVRTKLPKDSTSQLNLASLADEFRSSVPSSFDSERCQSDSKTLPDGTYQISNLYPKKDGLKDEGEEEEEEYYFFEEIIEISYKITFTNYEHLVASVVQQPSSHILPDGSSVPKLMRKTFVTPKSETSDSSYYSAGFDSSYYGSGSSYYNPYPQVNPSESEHSLFITSTKHGDKSLLYPTSQGGVDHGSQYTTSISVSGRSNTNSSVKIFSKSHENSNEELELGEKWSVINKTTGEKAKNKRYRNVMQRTVDEFGEIVEQLISEEYFSELSDSSSTHSSLENLLLSDEVELADNEFQPLTVFTHTLEDDPVYETETSEYQDVLPDGTLVKRRVTKTNKTQSVVKRVILEGFDHDEPFSDLGSSTLLPMGSSSDQSFTRYSDHTCTEPEVNTDVQLSEEQLKDGTIFRKRITNTKTQQLTTERLVVGGSGLFNLSEGGEDDVLSTLKQLSITRTSTG